MITEESANIQLNNYPETARWKVSDGTDIVAVNPNRDRLAIWTVGMGLHYNNFQEYLFVMKVYRFQAQFGRIWKQKFEHDINHQKKESLIICPFWQLSYYPPTFSRNLREIPKTSPAG